uniref:Dickkopf N-terminal cysteine-rich domain-containing protein n=1 Tax=Branchiostoma floridae TaxID=7739 RepID=C3ZLU7_BRAFL|eukprot:XP_002590559.1 hypothetical protein BRAFLDRAFT_86240 [Branchiostoma floridae]
MRPVLAAAVLTAVLLPLLGSSPAQATRNQWNGDAESELDYETEGEFFPAEEEEPTFRRHRHGKKRADGNDDEDEEEHLAVGGGVEDIGEQQVHKHHHHKEKARPASAESRELARSEEGEAAWNGDASTTSDYEEEWAGRKKGRHAGRKGKKGGKKGRKKGKGHRNNKKKNQIPVVWDAEVERLLGGEACHGVLRSGPHGPAPAPALIPAPARTSQLRPHVPAPARTSQLRAGISAGRSWTVRARAGPCGLELEFNEGDGVKVVDCRSWRKAKIEEKTSSWRASKKLVAPRRALFEALEVKFKHGTSIVGSYLDLPAVPRDGTVGPYRDLPAVHREGTSGSYRDLSAVHRDGTVGPHRDVPAVHRDGTSIVGPYLDLPAVPRDGTGLIALHRDGAVGSGPYRDLPALHRDGTVGPYRDLSALHRDGTVGPYRDLPAVHRTRTVGPYRDLPAMHRTRTVGPNRDLPAVHWRTFTGDRGTVPGPPCTATVNPSELPPGEHEIVTFDDIMGTEDTDSRPSVLPPVASKATPGGDAAATKLPDVRPTETVGQDVKKGRGGRGRGKGHDAPRLNGAQDVPTSDLEDFLGMRLPHNTTDVSCELHDDCFEGECCNANKGKCVAYKQEQGQRCKDSCMCRKGLRCFVRKAKKMVKTGKIRGQCMNPDDPDLPNGGAFLPDI